MEQTGSHESWEVTGTACADKCSHLEAQDGGRIIITRPVWEVIKTLCNKVEYEWQALLTGEVLPSGIVVTGYIIPKQRVSRGAVINDDAITKEFIEEHHVVAGIHSHSGMGVFFSTTDIKDAVMSLIDHHVVVNNKLELLGASKVTLPCGRVGIGKLKVDVGEPAVDADVVGIDNIKKMEYAGTSWQERAPLSRFRDERKPLPSWDEDYVGRTIREEMHYGY
jgi:proteasome lid subunit RPN8/RPN11